MDIGNNPQFIVNGFICSGITQALDGDPQVQQEAHDEEDKQAVTLTLTLKMKMLMRHKMWKTQNPKSRTVWPYDLLIYILLYYCTHNAVMYLHYVVLCQNQ